VLVDGDMSWRARSMGPLAGDDDADAATRPKTSADAARFSFRPINPVGNDGASHDAIVARTRTLGTCRGLAEQLRRAGV
jgi:hypothetical protein